MGKTNFKRLLCSLLSLAMVFALAVAPAYASEETSAQTIETTEPSTDITENADNCVSITSADETQTDEQIEAEDAENEEATQAPESEVEVETEEPATEEAATEEAATEEAATQAPQEEESTEALTAAQAVQAQIDALPTVDELAEMDLDEQNEVYTAFLAACEAYDALTEDEQADVDDTALDTLADYFNGMITVVTDTFQIGDTIYASWSDAIAAANDGDEIDLLRSVTYSSSSVLTVTAGKNVTLDLNGYTLSKTYSGTSTSSLITNNGTLTIIDSSEAQTGTISVIASNTSTISSATVFLAAIRNAGTLNLNGGTIKLSTKSTSSKMKLWCVVNTTSGASTVLDGASVVVDKTSTYYSSYGIYNNADNTSIVINSGSVSVSSPASASTAAVGTNTSCSSSSITMNDGELTVTCTRDSSIATAYYGILAESGSTTITGGEITVSSKGGAYGVKANENSPAEISNLTMSVSTDTTSSSLSYCLTAYANIYNGTYTMEDATNLSAAFGTGTTIYGGTYSDALDASTCLATGYTTTDNGNGTYTVGTTTTNVASVTIDEKTTEYATFAEAVAAADEASSDATITLLADVTVSENVEVSNTNLATVSLELDSHTLTIDSGATLDIRDVTLTSGSGITIAANGTLIAPDTWTDTSSVTAESGAIIYIFGVGYTYSESWSLSGSYLVEYFKTSRGGTAISESVNTTWTYPTVGTDKIFAGWYTSADYSSVYSDTSDVAYAKFVNIKYSSTDGGIIRYLGSALKMDTTTDDYSKTSLRFGYDFIIPTDCSLTEWSWDWGTNVNDLSSTLTGINQGTTDDSYNNAAKYFRSNLVVTDISSSDYELTVYAQASVSYTTGDNTPVSVTRSDSQYASVKAVAAVMQSDGTADEQTYANNILTDSTVSE